MGPVEGAVSPSPDSSAIVQPAWPSGRALLGWPKYEIRPADDIFNVHGKSSIMPWSCSVAALRLSQNKPRTGIFGVASEPSNRTEEMSRYSSELRNIAQLFESIPK